MMSRVILCLMLAGCSAYPVVPWPTGPQPPAPTLLPLSDLTPPATPTAEARGAALAAQAAALKARAASIAPD